MKQLSYHNIILTFSCTFYVIRCQVNKSETILQSEINVMDEHTFVYDRSNVVVVGDSGSTTEMPFYEQIFKSCNLQHPVFFTDRSHQVTFLDYVTQFLVRSEKVFTIVDVKGLPFENLVSLIQDLYVNHQQRDYVVVTSSPETILQTAETAFRRESFRRLAMLPHWTRWLVVASTPDQMKNITDQQHHSVLDNVAVLQLLPVPGMVYTFMWRHGRVRTPSPVNTSPSSRHGCTIFPNTLYGLNGRTLSYAMRVNLGIYLRYSKNPDTGRIQYSGPLVELLKEMSERFNFTYKLPMGIDNSTVLVHTVFESFVHNGSAEIGLVAIETTYNGKDSNVSVSRPIFFDTATGIYRQPQPSTLQLAAWFLLPLSYKEIFLAMIFCSLLLTVSLYIIIINQNYYLVAHSDEKGGDEKGESPVISPQRQTSSCRRLFGNVCKLVISFMTSLLNQGTLPIPAQVSARCLIAFWSMMAICLCSVYTSLMTADTVKHTNPLPFQSFNEMIAHGDYRWGTFNKLVVNQALVESRSGILAALNQSAEVIQLQDNAFKNDVANQFVNSMPEKYVFIYFRKQLSNWLSKNNKSCSEDFVLMKENLFSVNFGILFAEGSELNTLFSMHIMEMHDGGLVGKLLNGSHECVAVGQDSSTDAKSKQLHITVMALVISAFLLTVATGVLLLEKLSAVARTRRWTLIAE